MKALGPLTRQIAIGKGTCVIACLAGCSCMSTVLSARRCPSAGLAFPTHKILMIETKDNDRHLSVQVAVRPNA